MNNLYFACCDCKIYIDAGYRWAVCELEQTGVVSRRKEVSANSVLAADSFWNPPKEEASRWLYEEVFPPLREFLESHKNHRIVFGQTEDFAPTGDEDIYWMQIGYCAVETPRHLVEVLGLKTWDQVDHYMKSKKADENDYPPVWWECTWHGNPSSHEKGKMFFEQLVRERKTKKKD